MDLSFSPEQLLVQQTMREFSKKSVGPRARGWDEKREFPLETFRELGPLGFLGALIPPEYGGAGLDEVSYLLALEELAYGDPGFSVGIAVHTSVAAVPIVRAGTEEQKTRFLPDLASGRKIGAFAVTEPQSGSDAASIQTKATRRGDEYVLEGEKVFITNGSHAGQVVVAARTGPKPGKEGISLFVVDAKTPGFEVGGHEEKMGLHSSDTARLNFREMHVGADRRLGGEGEAFPILMRTLASSRLGISAQCLGIIRRALDESISYAKERKTFGQPLGRHQAVANMISDMATRLEAAKLMTYRAAADAQRGELRTEHASMAKLLAAETAVWAAETAVQIHGGNGYLKDFVVERLMRDAPVTRIYEGTSEVQKLIIGRALAKR